jgi:predicted ATP-grasp superfamily ATP-dependent carboligase
VPRQQRVERRDSAVDLAAFAPPYVVKPAHSVAGDAGARARHPVVHAADANEVRTVLARLPATAFPVLVQERITGAGVGVFLLVWNGELLAAFAHRRLREKPPAGGVSVYAESITVDQAVLARSRALVDRFGWNGVAMVEYKLDGVTAEPVLMEVNGRFWGSLQLAIDAGVDFPHLLVDAVLGRPVTPVTAWKAGVRGRWFWGDMDHALARLRRSARALHLAPDAPGRLATLAGMAAATLRLSHDQVFRLADPGPALRELRDRFGGRSR